MTPKIITAVGVLLPALVLSLLCVNVVHACGGVTHHVVGIKALEYFDFKDFPEAAEYVKKYNSAFQAGTSFPDWGYICPGYHDAGEAAHWPPFIEAATEYLIEKYPKPMNEEGQLLTAFIMGVVAHSVADISWHSLNNLPQGFIRSMANVDFAGNYDSAHSESDTGAEFLISRDYDLSAINDNWVIPYNDMYEVYQRINFTTVTVEKIVDCSGILFAATMGARYAAELVYPLYAKNSQFLVQQYTDFFNGGLDDMAAATTYCFPSFLRWVSTGKVDDEFCPVEPKSNTVMRETKKQESISKMNDLVSRSMASMITTEKSGNIVKHSYPSSKQSVERDATTLPMKNASPVTLEMYSPYQYAYFGKSLAKGDINGDGIDDLIVGASGYSEIGQYQAGSIFIIFGNANITTDLSPQTPNDIEQLVSSGGAVKIVGSYGYSRFGFSVTTLDLNRDGVQDVVIGAPVFGGATLEYIGKVLVYFGSKTLGKGQKNVLTQADIEITGNKAYSNFGTLVTTGDCDQDGHDDLIVASHFSSDSQPQAGQVAVFLSSAKYLSGQALDGGKNADLILSGEEANSWFGYAVQVSRVSPSTTLLVVSAPALNGPSGASVGKVLAYNLTGVFQSNTTASVAPLVFSILGANQFDMFGSSLSIALADNSVYLAVSMPSHEEKTAPQDNWQAGQVVVLDITNFSGKDVPLSAVPTFSVIHGEQEFALMGYRVLLRPSNGNLNLVVTAPRIDIYYDNGWKALKQAGMVYIWNNLPKGDVIFNPSQSADILLHAQTTEFAHVYYGDSLLFADLNGDGKEELVVAASKDTATATRGGTVRILSGL